MEEPFPTDFTLDDEPLDGVSMVKLERTLRNDSPMPYIVPGEEWRGFEGLAITVTCENATFTLPRGSVLGLTQSGVRYEFLATYETA